MMQHPVQQYKAPVQQWQKPEYPAEKPLQRNPWVLPCNTPKRPLNSTTYLHRTDSFMTTITQLYHICLRFVIVSSKTFSLKIYFGLQYFLNNSISEVRILYLPTYVQMWSNHFLVTHKIRNFLWSQKDLNIHNHNRPWPSLWPERRWAVVVAKLVEQSLPIPEIPCSNPVIGKFYLLKTNLKRRK